MTEQIFEEVGSFTNVRGLKENQKALQVFANEHPDNEEGREYLEALDEMIYQAGVENKG